MKQSQQGRVTAVTVAPYPDPFAVDELIPIQYLSAKITQDLYVCTVTFIIADILTQYQNSRWVYYTQLEKSGRPDNH